MLPSWLALNWTTLAAALGIGVAAALLFFALRRVLSWLLGPIFTWETVRLARKGHTFWLRVGFATLLLGLLYLAHPDDATSRPAGWTSTQTASDDFPQRESRAAVVARARMQKFADDFTRLFLLVLPIGTFMVTPLYFGTAISEEKEKRALDFLLATRLSGREIILGKLAARLLNLLGVLLAGLPVLALTLLWGGVDWRQIVHGFGNAALLMASSGSACLLCSVIFSRSRDAVIASYVLAAGVFAVGWLVITSLAENSVNLEDMCSALEIPLWLASVIGIAIPIAIHCALVLSCVVLSFRWLRFFAHRHSASTRKIQAKDRKWSKVLSTRPTALAANPRVGDNPLLWKERYVGRTFGGWVLGGAFWYYFYVAVIVAAAFIGALLSIKVIDPRFPLYFRVLTTVLATLVLVTVSLRLAGSVSREREQLTLISLLALPIERTAILDSKWRGTILRSRRAILGLVVSFLATAYLNKLEIGNLIVTPLLFAAQIWCFGNLGLLLSIGSGSTARACTLTLAFVIVLMAAGWTISYFSESQLPLRTPSKFYSPRATLRADRISVGNWINPAEAWWLLTSPKARDYDDSLLNSYMACSFAYFMGGSIFWLASWSLFRREGARS